ncbi:MAG: branched-chain amino acid ABC transporter permease [Allorhizobium sp.]
MLVFQTALNGLVLGGVYSLAAVGFSLIFGALGIVNLTHGIFVICGAYGAMLLFHGLGIDPFLATIPVGAVFFFIGYVYQRYLIQPAIARSSLVASLLVTFGVALIARNLLQLGFSPDLRTITPAYSFHSLTFGSLRIDIVRLIAVAVSLILLSLMALVLAGTGFGRRIRATAQQALAASLSGVNVPHVLGQTFGLGAAFAAASGAVLGIVQPFSPAAEDYWTLNAFIVVVLGGVGSPSGALLGGILLGLISSFTAQYIGPSFTNAVMFFVLVIMLLVRPQGLLGSAFGQSR